MPGIKYLSPFYLLFDGTLFKNIKTQVEMSKRFGEGVSLQDMEAFAVNRTLAELRETAKRAEENKYRRLEKKKVGTQYISFFLFGPSKAPKVKKAN